MARIIPFPDPSGAAARAGARAELLDEVRHRPLPVPFHVEKCSVRKHPGARVVVTLTSPLGRAELAAAIGATTGLPVSESQIRIIPAGALAVFRAPQAPLAASFFSALAGAQREKAPNPGGTALAAMLEGVFGVLNSAISSAFADGVHDYYGLIDRADRGDREALEFVLSMFNPDAVYVRAGVRYVGREAIERFYREEGKVRVTHVVEAVEVDGNVVNVRGTYSGVNGRGEQVAGTFADAWEFQGLEISKRTTVLGGSASADSIR